MINPLQAGRTNRTANPMTLILLGFFSLGAAAQSDGSGDQDGGSGSGEREDASIQATVLATNDGVIQPSLCVGGDCLATESFGDRTLKLKENNTRLLFEDTSNSGSFPGNDWLLIANESTNGGRNLFAIQDATAGRNLLTVEAGAPDNALLLDAQGDLGLGLPAGQSAAVELHVADGDTPTVRLQQTDQSGFSPQVWDMAGNETNFFVRDVTNGSQLPFKIRPGAASDSLVVEGNGNIGLGVTPAQAKLHVVGDARIDGSVYQLSSRSVKTEFETVEPARILDRLAGLDLGAWHYLEGPDGARHFGPAAEDFHAAFGLGESAERISLSDMAGIALGAAQALQKELDERDREIESLKARLERLEQALLEDRAGHGES
jgi:hypothetical protein